MSSRAYIPIPVSFFFFLLLFLSFALERLVYRESIPSPLHQQAGTLHCGAGQIACNTHFLLPTPLPRGLCVCLLPLPSLLLLFIILAACLSYFQLFCCNRYSTALAAARAKYYGQVVDQMGPHEAVTGALFDEHIEVRHC